jgi:hypothetical protein
MVDANVGVGAIEVHHQLDEGWNGQQGNKACT